MLSTYDFSKHDKEHYEKYEYSYGAIIFDRKHKKVLLMKTPAGFYGFPKGHKNDGETSEEAAAREIKEELGLDIDSSQFFGKVSLKYDAEYSEEILNKHIAKKSSIGERPYWNKVGKVVRKLVFYIAELDEDEANANLDVKKDEVESAEWVTFKDAFKKIKKSGSNHDVVLRQAINIISDVKIGGCDEIFGIFTQKTFMMLIAIIAVLMMILFLYVFNPGKY
jgi:8-oxo-dGTP pyrophosphatase MutT (NUDIX family)